MFGTMIGRGRNAPTRREDIEKSSKFKGKPIIDNGGTPVRATLYSISSLEEGSSLSASLSLSS